MKTLKLKLVAISLIATVTTFAYNISIENRNILHKNVIVLEEDIHNAIVKNNIAFVKKYISSKKDLNLKDPFGGSSPLITATLFGRTEIAKLLINAGAKINVQNNEGSTALITAAFFCRTEIVKILLKKGADKTIKNLYGNNAYQSVSSPFSEVKGVYEMMEKMLAPMGLKLDYKHLEKTRPIIAKMLE
ncbi:ankyrin repeat domain-containing protein [Flavobacterium aquatile]|uniref:Uncharacterized protein n=1 Tax=Flavobacterium aquatile LMG 4008 = ATCC 11947 TaxID=1453498 RepID=A0A095SQE6_9FLAO|nr:ankyrin repeat domain-containing protein [Flavobacterium aquatile]KGD66896.1 hypothetical protein LG45_15830 [Flavobacterium aquatile LMG 4008 = ATCC 11947]OXA67990.1 hypothetical protein B0A61_05850 [Flavobacterium aquatile LMG 4008 = ATCC 11947]GEC80032.1 hypothetical protein FAQ01_29020 [Flavobacterium aquatile]